MKKIAVVTGARSEYGLLRWVIDEIHHATELQLQLIVTGGHLSPEQGLTYRCIEEDGYDIEDVYKRQPQYKAGIRFWQYDGGSELSSCVSV